MVAKYKHGTTIAQNVRRQKKNRRGEEKEELSSVIIFYLELLLKTIQCN